MTHFRHFRGVTSYTVAVTVNQDTFQVGVATCCPKDQFSKAKGRALAMKRLQSHQYTIPAVAIKKLIEELWVDNRVVVPEVMETFIDSIKTTDLKLELVFATAVHNFGA